MKNILIFILSLLVGIGLLYGYKRITTIQNVQKLVVPVYEGIFSIEQAPHRSLKATITSFTGTVEWKSRIATESSTLTKPRELQQGEEVATHDDSSLELIIPNALEASVSANTAVQLIQTLPNSILLMQNSGKATYTQKNNNPVSIRSLSLLVQLENAEAIITVNDTLPFISVDVEKGTITVGFNDTDFITQTIAVSSGKRLVYNTQTRETDIVDLQ